MTASLWLYQVYIIATRELTNGHFPVLDIPKIGQVSHEYNHYDLSKEVSINARCAALPNELGTLVKGQADQVNGPCRDIPVGERF